MNFPTFTELTVVTAFDLTASNAKSCKKFLYYTVFANVYLKIKMFILDTSFEISIWLEPAKNLYAAMCHGN